MGFFGSPPPAADNDNVVTGGLSITGGTTSDTLSVTGVATFNTTSTFKGKLSITAGGLSVVGGLTSDTGSFSSTLSVTGTSTLHTVNATGGTFSGKLTISTGGLSVTGGGITVVGGLSSDTLDVSSSITVTGSANFNSGITAAGGASWTGNGSSGGTDFEVGLNDTSRGTPGTSGHYRALVKQATNVLAINYAGDFTGGVDIQGGSVTIEGSLTVKGAASFQSTFTMTGTGGITTDHVQSNGTTNLHVVPVSGGNAGFTNNARSKWGLRINDNSAGNPTAYTYNNTLDDGAGNMTVNGILIANSESHLSNGTYSDPQSGTPRGLKVAQGIATDYLWVSGGGHIDSYVNTVGTYQINSCALIQMAYVTIPNNGSGGYKWTFPTAIPSANGCQPLVTLNIVPGTQYFVNAGNNSRSACSYYHSSSGSLSGWIFEVSQ